MEKTHITQRRHTIVLKHPADCLDCGANLKEGTWARYYGRGKVYGLSCHPQKGETDGPVYSGWGREPEEALDPEFEPGPDVEMETESEPELEHA